MSRRCLQHVSDVALRTTSASNGTTSGTHAHRIIILVLVALAWRSFLKDVSCDAVGVACASDGATIKYTCASPHHLDVGCHGAAALHREPHPRGMVPCQTTHTHHNSSSTLVDPAWHKHLKHVSGAAVRTTFTSGCTMSTYTCPPQRHRDAGCLDAVPML